MKSIVAFVIVMNATAFAFGDTHSNEGSTLKVTHRNNDIYKIVFNEQGEQEVTLTLKDAKEKTLYTEYVQAINGFTKFLDLSTLPIGKYMLELKSSSKTIYEEVEIVDVSEKYNDILFIKDLGEEKTFVYAAKPLDTPLTVVVKGANNNTLFKGEFDLAKGQVFNFSKVIGDEVLLTIYEGNAFVKEKTIALD